MAIPRDLPLPPLELADRVGELGEADPLAEYVELGRQHRDALAAALPQGWSWEGKRALDFGCGAGRVLRHFADEADRCDFFGCDLHEPSIAWMQENLSPPFNAFLSSTRPPIPVPNGYFDLIWAVSVFTHLDGASWSGWLLDLRRLLKPGGILLASILGKRQYWMMGEAWNDEHVGMNALKAGELTSSRSMLARTLDGPELRAALREVPAPLVFHSEWWIRAHWGRAFEILSLQPEALGLQGLAVMRRREVELTEEDLERLEPNEPRELSATAHHARQLYAEAAEQRRLAKEQTAKLAELTLHHEKLVRQYAAITGGRSWRMTAPLRSAAAAWRLWRRRAG